jgi:uncharacterized protein DUF4337
MIFFAPRREKVMAELEIHHESEHQQDPIGQRVGILAAVLAVLLAIVTIASHRTHTDAIISRSAANDNWQYYQSTRVKYHSLELGQDLIQTLAPARSEEKIKQYEADKKKYEERGKKIQEEAREKEHETKMAEDRALRYDFGEGLLEIALVLSSLYFIARKKMFPAIGATAGLAGVAIAISGFMM